MSGIIKTAGVVGLVVASLAGGVGVAAWALSAREPELGTFHGVRLGMTASAVRTRFEEPSLGKWEAAPSASGEDTALAWHAAQGPEVAWFEFHAGMLVAVRAVVRANDQAAIGAPVEASRAVVRTRDAEKPGAVKVTILARGCPTHHAEAERLAAKAVDATPPP